MGKTDEFRFDKRESQLIENANDLELKAKRMLKDARKQRLDAAASRDIRRRQHEIDVLSIDSRATNFGKSIINSLEYYGFKLQDDSGFGGPQTKIILMDSRTGKSVELKAVAGKGIEIGYYKS